MRIAAVTLGGVGGWPTLEVTAVTSGLNTVYGPAGSGKTTLAEILAHALFGKPPVTLSVMGRLLAPSGEVIVEEGGTRYRVRRYQDAAGPLRLTVGALDGSTVDPKTISKLVRGLPPTVLSPLCAISFCEPPDVERLLSAEFAHGCQSIAGNHASCSPRRTAELAARRDLLAHELETRIAGERRVSKELEGRCRELDRLVRDEQQQVATLEQRLNAVENSLTETDARLRYRRLELNVEQHWQPEKAFDAHPPLIELDEQIGHWRAVLAELAQKEASGRVQLAQIQSVRVSSGSAVNDQRAWLAVARQLSTDLTGEVARLARSNGSERCVCRDAHARLRPIAETFERQLGVLEALVDEQNQALAAADLMIEVDHLAGSQAELRRHVDHLLNRRQAFAQSSTPPREDSSGTATSFSAADAEQLESRRLVLEQERFDVIERLRTHARLLRDLREERQTIDRQRAALLSARSIEHVQRELAAVQQKLELAANGNHQSGQATIFEDSHAMASDLLAKLTNGELVQVMLDEDGRRACVVNRSGETVSVASITSAQRDQVYLSLCLGLLSAASRQGIWLPLVLDEPFERLDPRCAAAMAAVLDEFSRQGHQLLVFTGQRAAAARLESVGAAVHDILSLRQSSATKVSSSSPPTNPAVTKKRKATRRIAKNVARKSDNPGQPIDGESSDVDRSDAA